MTTFTLRTVPGNCWPPLPDSQVAPVWAAYQELERTQWLTVEDTQTGQLAQARTLLAHAAEHVPYYRRLFADAAIDVRSLATLADFRRIPLLTRRTYQDHVAEFHSAQLPAGTQASAVLSSSGSSGIPVEVRQTDRVNLWWHALFLRDLAWCGFDPLGTMAAIRNFGARGPVHSAACWLPALAGLIETGPSHGIDIRHAPQEHLDWLRDVNPDYLQCYPSALEGLLHLLGDDPPRLPRLHCIQSIGETLSAELKNRAEVVFGVSLKNTYSTTEVGYIASPCPDGTGLHVHAENVLLEVLDEHKNPCAPGQTGRIVVTTLHNFRTPLIRYEIMDEAVVGVCSCGRGLPVLAEVLGRCLPLFRLPDGTRKSSRPLLHAVRKVGGHRQHQIVQKAVDHLLVRIVPDDTWTPTHANQIVRLAGEYLAVPIRIEVTIVERIDRARGGKWLNVLTEVPED